MIRWLTISGLVLAAAATAVTPAMANMAAIVTVAPVGEDESEDRLKAAAASALGRAVRGAQAMGLADVMLKSIRVVPGTGVVVEVVASDSGAEPEDEVEPSAFAPDGQKL